MELIKQKDVSTGCLFHGKIGKMVLVTDENIEWATYSLNEVLEPIPLTEEWLVKFGFIVKDEGWAFKAFYIEDRNLEEDSFLKVHPYLKDCFAVWGNGFLCDIKHVHQLQNLYFALTGEELTLKS